MTMDDNIVNCNHIKYVVIGEVTYFDKYFTLLNTTNVLISLYNYIIMCYKLIF